MTPMGDDLLRKLLEERRRGEFVSDEEGRRQTREMIARERWEVALRADADQITQRFYLIDDIVRRDLAEVEAWLMVRHGTQVSLQGVRHVSQRPEELCGVFVLGLGDVSEAVAREEACTALRGLGQTFVRHPQLDSYQVDPIDIRDYSAHEKADAFLRVSTAFEKEEARREPERKRGHPSPL